MSRHAVRIARDHCLAAERVDPPIYGGRYRALFPDLPAVEADETALHALARPGGSCDLGVDPTEDDTVRLPTALIQPMAADDVARAVTRITEGAPSDGIVEIGGPEASRFNRLISYGLSVHATRVT